MQQAPKLVDLRDARWFQLGGQAAILIVGLLLRDFGVSPAQCAAAIGAAAVAQWAGSLLIATRFDWKSAVITGLSLSLLLRANDIWPFAAAAMIAIGSKFALRAHDRHIFNPANFSIVVMILFTNAAWTSTSEWGSALWLAALIAALGALSCWRASRLDVPIIYLASYASLVIGRALYLGDPLAIPALRLSHGALILFAFFMISDPKTTPEDPRTRAAFVATAALIAYVLQFHFFISDGIFYAPAILALAQLVFGRAGRGAAYEWGRPPRAIAIPNLRTRKRSAPPAPAE
jgi:Na+-transporting NADH:ubiquinone oxidoreductase subunit NqrB